MEADGINFVRRKSGGGTVYHVCKLVALQFACRFPTSALQKPDLLIRMIRPRAQDLGNINCTFMTSRDRYNKTRYTNLIADVRLSRVFRWLAVGLPPALWAKTHVRTLSARETGATARLWHPCRRE